jgi:hypothetical protein
MRTLRQRHATGSARKRPSPSGTVGSLLAAAVGSLLLAAAQPGAAQTTIKFAHVDSADWTSSNKPTSTELDQFRNAAQPPVVAWLKTQVEPGWIEALQAAVADARKSLTN